MRRTFVASALLFAFVAALFGAVVLVAETSTPALAGCRCPLVYAPVVCDHGKTYPNPCEADCHHAKNCVPTGGF